MHQNMNHCTVPGSLVRPKIMRSVHYCPATKKTLERKYTDLTSLDAFPSSAIYPTKVFLTLWLLKKSLYPGFDIHRFVCVCRMKRIIH